MLFLLDFFNFDYWRDLGIWQKIDSLKQTFIVTIEIETSS